MTRRLILIVLAFVVLFVGAALFNRTFIENVIAPSPVVSSTPKISVSPSSFASSQPRSSPTAIPAVVSQVKIYLIAINDQGKSGTKIGCGDSVVAVTREVTPTTMPLTIALNQLLSLNTQYYGQSGLYDSLYQSTLKVDSASVKSGTATIYLSGTLKLGGECDNPRVEAQLIQTAMQFPTVNKVLIYVNNKTLQEALSLK